MKPLLWSALCWALLAVRWVLAAPLALVLLAFVGLLKVMIGVVDFVQDWRERRARRWP